MTRQRLPLGLIGALLLAGCSSSDTRTGGATAYTPKPLPTKPFVTKPLYIPDTQPKPISTPATVNVSAQQLYDESTRSFKEAKAKYAGKVIEISGTVGAVMTNPNGQPEVYLQAGSNPLGVKCLFYTEEKFGEKVSRGQQVRIKGLWPEYATVPGLVDCVFAGR